MYQLTEESINHFLDVGKRLAAKLKASPFWSVIEDEEIIKEVVAAYLAIEGQVIEKQTVQ